MDELFKIEDVFSVLNYKEAEKYIGTQGYFADSLKGLTNEIMNKELHLLDDISYISPSFVFKDGDEMRKWNALFIPANKVKKYRPFRSIAEFTATTGKDLGSVIVWKPKSKKDSCKSLITSFFFRDDTDNHFAEVEIGTANHDLQYLFQLYEWKDEKGDWRPFGVQVK